MVGQSVKWRFTGMPRRREDVAMALHYCHHRCDDFTCMTTVLVAPYRLFRGRASSTDHDGPRLEIGDEDDAAKTLFCDGAVCLHGRSGGLRKA